MNLRLLNQQVKDSKEKKGWAIEERKGKRTKSNQETKNEPRKGKSDSVLRKKNSKFEKVTQSSRINLYQPLENNYQKASLLTVMQSVGSAIKNDGLQCNDWAHVVFSNEEKENYICDFCK